MALENYGTIWICEDCLGHLANGECGGCHSDHGHDEEPLNAVQLPFRVELGIGLDDHDGECDDYENCDCGTRNFSHSQCEGCNSWLYGAREAVTLFRE